MAARTSNAPLVTRRAQRRLGIVLVLPVAVMTVVFFLLPLANALVYSVVDSMASVPVRRSSARRTSSRWSPIRRCGQR